MASRNDCRLVWDGWVRDPYDIGKPKQLFSLLRIYLIDMYISTITMASKFPETEAVSK